MKNIENELERIDEIKEEMVGYKYRHYRGNTYKVIDIGIHTETYELMVLYKNTENNSLLFCRPLSMFLEKIDDNIARFTKIS